MNIVDTFHVGCNCGAPEGAALLVVLTKGDVDDYAAYQGVVTLPDTSNRCYKRGREQAAWRVAACGDKLSRPEAERRWPWLKDKEYRS